ncbi:NAD(P)-binding domain-containing protein [Albimonas sp. CAU 1670]|uniref:NADPH-dependent F420 reductase n=1 Tax=Albimonas sp. CAU 1670 TaxID=3032599 RepID=UPI0023DCAB7C|nr:NAD(P)-binding domain-containing protein [Albimonas sp. CAU 1670]MDF2235483.1 NAD(P)-binding domain-containing protein [Albimonas sp. CAU 1670]
MTDIAILGPGPVGEALGGRFAAAGHRVIYGSRDPGAEAVRAVVARTGDGARAAAPIAAAQACEVAVIALPWGAVETALPPLAEALAGKTVIDATNPLRATPAGPELSMGFDVSGGERVQALLPGARVVKAFNTTGWGGMVDPVFEGRRSVMFHCGDDAAACETARGLIEDVGFEAVHAGPLSAARLTEAHAMLWIHLAYRGGQGRDWAFGLLRRG